MDQELRFPKDFLWGTATSAYQVEGGINNADWSKIFSAGRACNHYHQYEQNFNLMQKLNQNVYRFSIEWSRVEPESGRFAQEEIEHYRKFLQALKKRRIKTMITLHHFTTPLWLSEQGGWANKRAVFHFSRFAQKMLEEYKNLADFWITINEPMIYASLSYLGRRWPPQKRNLFLFLKVLRNQISAHKRAYNIFRRQGARVGIAKNNQFFEPFSSSPLDRVVVLLADYYWNKLFLNKIKNHLDFIGLNYYFHNRIQFPFKIRNENESVSDLGWEIYPKGIYYVLKDLKKYNLPVYVTENGLADRKDRLRKEFIKSHLCWIWRAIQEEVEVAGYLHWSLVDNFEWDLGIDPRFGLIEIDYQTIERKVRPSGFFYAKICKKNSLVL